MRKLEIALCITSFVSIKWVLLFLLPGGSLLIMLFLTLSSMFYFWFGFALFNNIQFRKILKRESYQNVSSKRILGAVFTGWFLSATILGILFKIMFWTGANFNLIIGICGLTIIMLIGYTKYQKSNSTFYKVIFKRIAVVGMIGIIFLCLPLNFITKIKYRNRPAYAEALIKSRENPENLEYQKALEVESEKTYPE